MELIVKRFEDLSVRELYEIYKLRVSVFVVEQNCPYQEVDALDPVSWHMWLEEDGEILAYIRIMKAGVHFKEAVIGRVISGQRGKGYGLQIVQAGIRFIEEELHENAIRIEAQLYARGFYEKAGFVKDSEPFDEDGILHIEMVYRSQQ